MHRLSRDLVTFIRAHLPSVWALELLLLLREEEGAAWNAEDMVRELRASEAAVATGLNSLQQNGLVVETAEGLYRYAPTGPAMATLCDEVARVYRERPSAIMSAISAPEERLRR